MPRHLWWALGVATGGTRHPTCAYLVSRSPVRPRSIPFVFTSIQLYREGGAKNSASRQLSRLRSQPRCFVLSSLFLFVYHRRFPQTWSTRCWDLQRLQWLRWFAVRSESSLQECRSNSDCPEFYRFVKDEANQLVCAEKGSTNFLFVIPVPTCKRFTNVIMKMAQTFFFIKLLKSEDQKGQNFFSRYAKYSVPGRCDVVADTLCNVGSKWRDFLSTSGIFK